MNCVLKFFVIENFSTVDNITYYQNCKNQLSKLPIGAHLKYNGAFGITKDLLTNIHPKLEDYVPSHHAVFIGNNNIHIIYKNDHATYSDGDILDLSILEL